MLWNRQNGQRMFWCYRMVGKTGATLSPHLSPPLRLQAVMCIISTIMESCPSTSSFYSTAAAKTQHNGMNNIIRLFLKKGLVNDLARVPHSLDLSRYTNYTTISFTVLHYTLQAC